MSEYTLKQHVEGQVKFLYYRDQRLWYKTDTTQFEFPIPIEDVGNATFMATDKALLFMRYIRQHLHLIETARECNESSAKWGDITPLQKEKMDT